MNQLNVSLQNSITTLAAKGWSARKIARELGVHLETVGRYLQPTTSKSKPANPPIGSEAASVSKPANVPLGSNAGRASHIRPADPRLRARRFPDQEGSEGLPRDLA